jgi:phosphomannomutase/phosphoglucomutase
MIDSKLFKKYDIRGTANLDHDPDGGTLTPDAAILIGQAFGVQQFRAGVTRVVVGRDNRQSSARLSSALADGLYQAGMRVTYIGIVSTPVVYWQSVHMSADGGGTCAGIMVTGSHLPPSQNGFKLWDGRANLWGDAIQMLRILIEGDDLDEGHPLQGWVAHHAALPAYIADIAARVTMPRPLKVVIDAGNGTAGVIAPELFARWGHSVECLYCESDGRYPNHPPDPQVPANLRDLGAKVRETGADIGVAFDGDGDRVGAVDENGAPIAADRLLALLARDLLTRQPGAPIVADVLCSQVLFDAIRAAGGVPVMAASGHSLVKARMAELGSPLGGEMSGHVFVGEDYYGFDDAYLVAGRLLALLGASGRSLSALDASLPRLYSTPEYRPHCPDELKQTVIDAVGVALAGSALIETVDGVRAAFASGWGIIRASNTEPVLSLRFEGATEADALAIRGQFADVLARFPDVAALT